MVDLLTPELARERAAAGARLLDTAYYGWAEHVPGDRLDMHNPCCCVLGWVYGDFGHGLEQLLPSESPGYSITGRQQQFAVQYGFDKSPMLHTPVLGPSPAEQWRNLETAWINEIAIRVMAPLA